LRDAEKCQQFTGGLSYLAAIVQYVMLGRMIKTQRQQIGIFKALGFSRRRSFCTMPYSMVITVLGAILGIILGHHAVIGDFQDLRAVL
jgi:ABC-type lipoprotein release transport system permease subunit